MAANPDEHIPDSDETHRLAIVDLDWDKIRAVDLLAVLRSFLGKGQWKADIFADGPNADRAGIDYARSAATVKPTDALTLKLAPGGGYAAKFVKE